MVNLLHTDMPYILRNYCTAYQMHFLPELGAARVSYITGLRDASDLYDSAGCLDAPQFIPSGSMFRTKLGGPATMIVER